jgi:hypothetical protein
MNRNHLHLCETFAFASLGSVTVGMEGAQWWLTGQLDTVDTALLAIGLLVVAVAVLQCVVQFVRPEQPGDDLMDLVDVLCVSDADLTVLAAYEHEIAHLDTLAARVTSGGTQ